MSKKNPNLEQLRMARAAIRAVCKEYDCAANVVLVKHERVLWFNCFPKWSSLRTLHIDGEPMVHVRAKREDYPSELAHRRAVEGAINVLDGFVTVCGNSALGFRRVLDAIRRKVEFETTTYDHNKELEQ